MWCWKRGVLVRCLSFNPKKWGVSVKTRTKINPKLNVSGIFMPIQKSFERKYATESNFIAVGDSLIVFFCCSDHDF